MRRPVTSPILGERAHREDDRRPIVCCRRLSGYAGLLPVRITPRLPSGARNILVAGAIYARLSVARDRCAALSGRRWTAAPSGRL